jgi:hypothetical protein
MRLLLRLTTGAADEAPQQTHFWNNTKFPPERLKDFDQELFVRCEGVPDAPPVGLCGMGYIHAFTKWRQYAAISPERPEEGWHIGWTNEHVSGVSRIRLTTPVRVTLGPGPNAFFGVASKDGAQRKVTEIGRGVLGHGGPLSKLPLL